MLRSIPFVAFYFALQQLIKTDLASGYAMSAPKATSKLTPTSQWSGRMCDYPLPEHPPGSGPRLEQWTGWEAWDRYCDVRQQADWLRLLIDILMPLLDAYYSQDKNHPGFIGEYRNNPPRHIHTYASRTNIVYSWLQK
jgi:hypothetical protein